MAKMMETTEFEKTKFMAFDLKPATLEDLDFVQNCAVAAYEKYVERMGKRPAPMVADFTRSIEGGQLEIILSDSEYAGYCVSFEKTKSLFVENIALHPDHQGKGLATLIFGILENRARVAGLTSLNLYTNVKMHENLSFYSKLGFIETHRLIEEGFHRVFFKKQV